VKSQDLEQTCYDLIYAAKYDLLGAVNNKCTCMYHFADKVCAIGYLLPDSIHSKIDKLEEDGYTINTDSAVELVQHIPSVGKILKKHSLSLDLAQELQVIHDESFTAEVSSKQQIKNYITSMESFMSENIE